MITEQPATDSNAQVMAASIGGSVAVAVAVGVIIFAIIRYMFCLMSTFKSALKTNHIRAKIL